MLEYRLDVSVTENDFNEDGTIKLSSLLFFFQEAATQHADIIGVGMDALLEQSFREAKMPWELTDRFGGPTTVELTDYQWGDRL